jgi:DNA-binding XRE family transcriptional regulator
MNTRKRQRLEAKGWRFGTADEFLGLTQEESTVLAFRLALCDLERDLRQQRELTQLELAKKLGSSQSRVAKLEACDPTVSIDLVLRSLVALGASGTDIGRAFEHADKKRLGAAQSIIAQVPAEG